MTFRVLTKCKKKGHDLLAEGTYRWNPKTGNKICRKCDTEAVVARENKIRKKKHAAKNARNRDALYRKNKRTVEREEKKSSDEPTAREELAKIAVALREIERRKRERKLDFYEPYPKQLQFHALGKTMREIAMLASSRSGKTYSAAAEVAMHLTGIYAPDFPGRRFDKPTKGWVAGITSLLVRDVNQTLLFGSHGVVEDQGTGMVPRDCVDWKTDVETVRGGHANAYDNVKVKHISGGKSMVSFRSFEQGRAKFQADTLDWVWLDEEPPMDIYSECLTRLATTAGLMLCTFTPLLGMSEVVIRYLQEPSPDRGYVNMTIDDALHFTPEERVRIVAGYPAHEREARARGIPMLGSGAIFQVSDESITEEPIINVPAHWAKGIGIDFGIDHPFAAVQMAWDRDADCIHLLRCLKMKDARPIDHAAAMKPWGLTRVFWPHDGSARDKGSGNTLASIYKTHGVKMYSTHSSFPDGSISTEAGIKEMQERMTTGRFKVGADLTEWFAEKRMYHRKEGLIVRQNDDLLSATRVGLMMRRFWSDGFVGDAARLTRHGQLARDVEFPLFGTGDAA